MTKRTKKIVSTSQQFEEYITKIREEVNNGRIASFSIPIIGDITPFAEMVSKQKKLTGKLLRPVLCVLINDAFHGNHQMAIMFGAAIEHVHNGSLVHDDILDNDLTRRGQPTYHAQFGNKAATLLGDLLQVAGLGSISTIPPLQFGLSTGVLVEAISRMVKGASMEEDRKPLDESQYLEIVRLKTATAYRSAGRLATISANIPVNMADNVATYAENIGIAFQLADDLTDIYKSIDENMPLGDMRDGKVTTTIAYLARKHDLSHELTTYRNGITDLDDIKHMMQYIDEGIKHTEDLINSYVDGAISNARFMLTDKPYSDYLLMFPRYAVNSILSEANRSI